MEVIALSAAAAQVTKFNGNGGHIQGAGEMGVSVSTKRSSSLCCLFCEGARTSSPEPPLPIFLNEFNIKLNLHPNASRSNPPFIDHYILIILLSREIKSNQGCGCCDDCLWARTSFPEPPLPIFLNEFNIKLNLHPNAYSSVFLVEPHISLN